MSFTDDELEAAIAALSDPGRLDAAQRLVASVAPSLQGVLAAALQEGGWFDSAHNAAVQEAISIDDHDRRLTAV
ncbi:MAG TPA: hypothetical protein VME01_08785, partial [Solirubrobacteraceae bacterium]|nr:hypothetical protein [Solirubrobacteraceae bacterium]